MVLISPGQKRQDYNFCLIWKIFNDRKIAIKGYATIKSTYPFGSFTICKCAELNMENNVVRNKLSKKIAAISLDKDDLRKLLDILQQRAKTASDIDYIRS